MMVMKAMSLNLVKGVVDEVEEVVHINWILPRYLNTSHLNIMVNKLNDWDSKMDQIIRIVENSS